MEEIIRGSKRLFSHLPSFSEGLTFMARLIASQENFVYSLQRHIHHCFFYILYQFYCYDLCKEEK